MKTPNETALRFGPFSLHLRRRVLTEAGREIRLGGRAMDLLAALTVRPGEVMTHEELVREVWPKTIVEETSLRVHIHALRKALGDSREQARYIANVPGKGYRFVAPIEVCDTAEPGDAGAVRVEEQTAAEVPRGRLPFHSDAMVGRAGIVQDIQTKLETAHLVTVVGAGGIGKTRVAVAVGHALRDSVQDGVWFVDLSPIVAPTIVCATVAIALGVFVHGDKPWPRLKAHLRGRRLLIVLDNCEHLSAEVVSLVTRMLSAPGDVRILATSRAPLGIPGEVVTPMPPLDADEASQLFVERARSAAGDFGCESDAKELVKAICGRLDGVPLAIELTAARVESLGLDQLQARLEDIGQLLATGRRAAAPRHRTLEALLDWSHELLGVQERLVLRRLSVFRGRFTMQAAIGIATCPEVGASAVERCIESLVAKSLIVRQGNGATAPLRLLYLTRAYAEQKLAVSEEAPEYWRRHARHVCQHLYQACAELREIEEADLDAWHEREATILDDTRAAIDRSFAPGGDKLSGVEVCAAARFHVQEFGLYAEFAARIRSALMLVEQLRAIDPLVELRLCISWCFVGLMVGHGVGRETFADHVLQLIDQVADRDDKIEGLYGLLIWASNVGDHMAALEYLGRLRQLVPEDDHPAWALLGERMLATTYHHLGDHDAALPRMQKVFDHPTRKVHREYVGQGSRKVAACSYLIRIQWIQGRSDDAASLLENALTGDYARHPMAMGTLVVHAGLPLLLWQGKDRQAQQLLDALKDQVAHHELVFWTRYIDVFEQVLNRRLLGASSTCSCTSLPVIDLFATFAEDMLRPETLARVEAGSIGWCAPEILRADAENRLRADPCDPSAESVLDRALALARCQGAVAWELRVACSLARYWASRNATVRAHALLAGTLGRIRQGFDTSDVVRATELLVDLERDSR
ncbi:ATP-binding protein [Rubrivivax sp. RP6-9]|uniref:ATP-binding protein n=1 Tax=Rubrivivax sp. RP6-9 TaxID=3415750 RepID=UPI003CC5DF7D